MTTAIVLAAGIGSRLAEVATLPKWLVPVGPTCPATEQLGGLHAAGITEVRVVVGDQSDEIESHVSRWRDRLDFDLIHNDHSTTRNNWYSLLIGLRAALGRALGDVLVLNSDLFADRRWFEESIGAVRSTAYTAAIGVDPSKGHVEEAMKVRLDPSGERIVQIGKTGIEHPGGEYVGVAWWGEQAAAELLEVLERFVDQPADVDNWYEHGIQDHLATGRIYGAARVASPAWVEIDDPRDLAAAAELLEGRMP